MRLLSWLLTLLLLVVAICFALHNDQDSSVNMWPFEATATLPLYILVLGTLFTGFFIGVSISWISHMPHWMETRRLRRETSTLKQKLEEARKTVPYVEKSPRHAYMSWSKSKWRLGGRR